MDKRSFPKHHNAIPHNFNETVSGGGGGGYSGNLHTQSTTPEALHKKFQFWEGVYLDGYNRSLEVLHEKSQSRRGGGSGIQNSPIQGFLTTFFSHYLPASR